MAIECGERYLLRSQLAVTARACKLSPQVRNIFISRRQLPCRSSSSPFSDRSQTADTKRESILCFLRLRPRSHSIWLSYFKFGKAHPNLKLESGPRTTSFSGPWIQLKLRFVAPKLFYLLFSCNDFFYKSFSLLLCQENRKTIWKENITTIQTQPQVFTSKIFKFEI